MSKNPYVLTKNHINDFFVNKFEGNFEESMVKIIGIFLKESKELFTKVFDKIDTEYNNDKKFAKFLNSDICSKLSEYGVYAESKQEFVDDWGCIEFAPSVVPGEDEIEQMYYLTDPTAKIRREMSLDPFYNEGADNRVSGDYEICRCDDGCQPKPLKQPDYVSKFIVDELDISDNICQHRKRYNDNRVTDLNPFTYCYTTLGPLGPTVGTSIRWQEKDAITNKRIELKTYLNKCEFYNELYRILMTYTDVVYTENPELWDKVNSKVYPFATAVDDLIPEEYTTKQEIYKKIVGNLLNVLNVKDIVSFIMNSPIMENIKLRVALTALCSISKHYKNVSTMSSSEFMIAKLNEKLSKLNHGMLCDRYCQMGEAPDRRNKQPVAMFPEAINVGSQFVLFEAISSLFKTMDDCDLKLGDVAHCYQKPSGYWRSTPDFLQTIIRKIYLYFIVENTYSIGDISDIVPDFKIGENNGESCVSILHSMSTFVDVENTIFNKAIDINIDRLMTYNEVALKTAIDELFALYSNTFAKLVVNTFMLKYMLTISNRQQVFATRDQLSRMTDSLYTGFNMALRDFANMDGFRSERGVWESEHLERVKAHLNEILTLDELRTKANVGIDRINSRVDKFVRNVRITNECDDPASVMGDIVAPMVGGVGSDTNIDIVQEFINDEDVNITNVEEKCEEALDCLELAYTNEDYSMLRDCAKKMIALENYYLQFVKDATKDTKVYQTNDFIKATLEALVDGVSKENGDMVDSPNYAKQVKAKQELEKHKEKKAKAGKEDETGEGGGAPEDTDMVDSATEESGS